MKKKKVIQSLDALTNSKAGNPRYKVFFTDGTSAITKIDASVAWGLGNPENVAPNIVEVTFERGKIVYVTPTGKSMLDPEESTENA